MNYFSLCLVAMKDNDNWNWFLYHLRTSIGLASYSSFIFISDRDIGLKNALLNIFPESEATICLRHFLANIRKKVKNKAILEIFWKCALSFDIFVFNQCFNILKGFKEIYEMINDNIPQLARSKIEKPRFGQFTSNISESINSTLRESRKLSDLDLIIYIYNYISEKFCQKLKIREFYKDFYSLLYQNT